MELNLNLNLNTILKVFIAVIIIFAVYKLHQKFEFFVSLRRAQPNKVFSNEPEVQFVSITVDPEVDNQKKLKEYSNFVGGDDGRWHFLWSDIDSIKNLKRNGFMLFADNLPEGHAIKFVLIDHEGTIRKYYDGTDNSSQEILKRDVAQLVKGLRT